MMLASEKVSTPLKEMTGNIMTISYMTGLTVGSMVGYVFENMLGPPLIFPQCPEFPFAPKTYDEIDTTTLATTTATTAVATSTLASSTVSTTTQLITTLISTLATTLLSSQQPSSEQQQQMTTDLTSTSNTIMNMSLASTVR
jgi:solute carrier family 29 (equilibrative nucleoside transporter) protein 4